MTDRSKEHGDMHVQADEKPIKQVQQDHKHVKAEENYLTSIKMTQHRHAVHVAKASNYKLFSKEHGDILTCMDRHMRMN